MVFEWDEAKNKLNRRKHGIWFEEVKSVFEDPMAKVFYDEFSSDSERRFLILGNNTFGVTLLIVDCFRKEEEVIRIISARKATKKERIIYEERI